MFKSRRLFASLAFGFALTLIASACGGTSSSSTDVADQPTTTLAAPLDDATTTTTTTTTTSAAPAGHDDEAEDPDHDDDEAAPNDDADAGDADRVVEVAMDDFSFSPDNFAVTAGETVTFVVTNVGMVEHELRLSNEHRIEEHMADGHSDDDHDDDAAAEEAGHEETADMFLHLEAGASGEITVTFPMDMTLFTEVACLIPGHYEAGMAADLEYNI